MMINGYAHLLQQIDFHLPVVYNHIRDIANNAHFARFAHSDPNPASYNFTRRPQRERMPSNPDETQAAAKRFSTARSFVVYVRL